jgi:hypothetical protein
LAEEAPALFEHEMKGSADQHDLHEPDADNGHVGCRAFDRPTAAPYDYD